MEAVEVPGMERRVSAVLSGAMPYDDLDDSERAEVRAIWDRRIAEALSRLDFRAEFEAAGLGWVESDDQGRVILRP